MDTCINWFQLEISLSNLFNYFSVSGDSRQKKGGGIVHFVVGTTRNYHFLWRRPLTNAIEDPSQIQNCLFFYFYFSLWYLRPALDLNWVSHISQTNRRPMYKYCMTKLWRVIIKGQIINFSKNDRRVPKKEASTFGKNFIMQFFLEIKL